jgi:hypothetical protein
MLLGARVLTPAHSVISGGEAHRDLAIQQQRFSRECERWLDHWYSGSAQRRRLRENLLARVGTVEEPRGGDPLENDGDEHLTDDGRDIAAGRTELICVGFTRNLAENLGVLYDSDDLERIYQRPDGSIDQETTRTLGAYHSPSAGGLTAALHQVDAWLVGLRTVGLLVSWVEDLVELSYQVLPPHWFHFWPRQDAPADPRLAYACAYSEQEATDDDGRPVPAVAFTCYVRPALPGDPPDAPTRAPGFEQTGRLVRYRRKTSDGGEPWPIPEPGSELIVADQQMPDGFADGPNPLIEAGGFEAGRRVWCPLVLHHAEPLVASLRLPVADHYSQLGEEIDLGLTAALHVGNLQTAGVPVFIGPGDPPDTIGPGHPVRCMDGGDFKFVAPGSDSSGHLELVRRLAGLAATFEHLPSDTFADQPPSIETGPAKQLRRAALISQRTRRTVDAERPEQRRFEVERVLHNAFGAGPKIPWDTRLVIHWGELATPADWGKRLTEMAQELSMGLSSVVDLIMERHGVSREEAERRAEAVAGKRVKTPSKPAAPDEPIGDQDDPTPDNGDDDEEIGNAH